MTIEERLTNLENLVNGYIKNQERAKAYTDSDIQGVIHTENGQAEQITQNTADIDYIAMETGVDL